MNRSFLIGITMFAVIVLPASAQDLQRRATMMGGGDRDRGKCTVEVLVDGRAEVDIRGDTATLRDLGGAAPQWRRFECSGPMPNNPAEFRFAGVNGRGSQRLVRDPNSGGTAVVQIEDPENEAGVYTFDIIWGGAGSAYQGDRGDRRRFSPDDAVRSCQDAVRQQAVERFHVPDVSFRRLEANDNPAQRDSVKGVFDLRRDGRDEAFRFSCSVDFDNGRVFNAQIESFGGDRLGQPGDRDRGDRGDRGNPGDRAFNSCQRAVEERIMRDGYRDVRIDSIRFDDRPGRNDRVIGNARADTQGGRAAFTFSCAVDPADADVRSVDVQSAR